MDIHMWHLKMFKNVLDTLIHVICSSADIYKIFYLLPHLLNHVWSYICNCCSDLLFKVLDVSYLLSLHNVFNVSPEKKVQQS